MSNKFFIPFLVVVAAVAQTPEDDPHANQKMRLAQAGVEVTDEAALIRTLNQRTKPFLAVSAAYFLGRLPKSELAIRELNAATLADYEFLSLYAMESLMGWGDRQWVSGARSRLRNYKDKAVRVSVAGLLARAGVYDGWDIVETTILHDPQYGGIAVGQVSYFRDMKELSGQPFDLVKRLDSVRSASASRALRERLLQQINYLTRQPPPSSPARKQP